MIVEPKVRVMLQEQISIVQGKMMDRAMDVYSAINSDYGKFSEFIEENGNSKLLFDTLINIYNNYTNALINDILVPLEDLSDQRSVDSITFTGLVRRLNKGYANFVYDTTRFRLYQIMKEAINNKELNIETENTAQSHNEEEPSFPEENQGVGD